MAQTNNGALEREIFIEAPPKTVFGFLTEPEKMLLWMGVEAKFEGHPGGIYRVNVNGEDVASGEVVEVTPPERVVYTWGWEGGETLPPGQSLIEITLTATDKGTMLKMVHSGLPEPMLGPHGDGWDHFVPRLAIAAAGGDPGRDPWVKEKAAG